MFEFDLPESGHGFEADPCLDFAAWEEDTYQWDRFDEG
jgi:hypothetical protein